MNSFIGLDIGSSSVKVGIFDDSGDLLAFANHPYSTAEPSHGYKEQNPADWWNAVTKGIREVLGIERKPSILAIGITGHISSLTFVDSDGRPLRPAIGFQDQRAFAEVACLAEFYTRSELASQLAIDLPPAPTWPLPKLLWMRKHEPALLDRSRYLLQAKDYINLQLTGEIASDLSSNRGMVNLSTDQPATDVFDRLNLPNLLPPLLAPHRVVGAVTPNAARATGLSPGVPVIVGWNDLNASVLGSGVVRDGQAFDVTGTSEHIGIVTNLRSSAEQLICAPYLPGKHLLYGVMSSGGGSLQWFKRLSGKSIDELLAITPSSSGDLLFLPYLEGERSPIWDPHASGVLVGLRSAQNAGNVARAILEGVAFSLRQSLDILAAQTLLRPDTVIASGGASRISLWNQIKASVLKSDVVTLRNPHAGIQGAVILAAVAVGIYPDLETAASAMTQVAETFSPQAENLPHLDRLFTLFNQVYPALRGTLSQLSAETLSRGNEAKAMTNTRQAVVFGAGKIARGFIAHLLTLSGYRLTFVEKNQELVDLMRRREKYSVEIIGAPEKNILIQNFDICHVSDPEGVAQAIANASVVFVSIGGPNLPQIAPLLAAGLERRNTGINIIIGENYFQPGQWLRQLISEELSPFKQQWFAREVGIVETMILRSTIEPTDEMKVLDPLSLKAQDMWEIPADKAAFVGEIPPIQGLSPMDNFQGGLIRKLFTYNCLNAIIAYMGHLRGFALLSDAANDLEIVEMAREAYRETGPALCQRYGFDPEAQMQFAEAAIAKYQRREIVDPIERNARDPLRKLSQNDRLVGPACLAIEYGTRPTALSRGIAAAFLYSSPKDPTSLTLQQIVRSKGIRAALGEVCKIDTAGELADLIVESYANLKDNHLTE